MLLYREEIAALMQFNLRRHYTSSPRAFFSFSISAGSSSLAVALSKGKLSDISFEADVFDFHNRAVTIAYEVAHGKIKSVRWTAKPDTLRAISDHLQHNMQLLRKAYGDAAEDLKLSEDGNGNGIAISVTSEHANQNQLFHALSLLAFFPIYPHPTTIHYLRRASLLAGEVSHDRGYDYRAMREYQGKYGHREAFISSGKPGDANYEKQHELADLRLSEID